MKCVSIKFFSRALPAVRAAEKIHEQSIPAHVVQSFKLVTPISDVVAANQAIRDMDFECSNFDYSGPRYQTGHSIDVSDPTHALLLASVLDQAAILAEMASLRSGGMPVAPIFAGIARNLREGILSHPRLIGDETLYGVEVKP